MRDWTMICHSCRAALQAQPLVDSEDWERIANGNRWLVLCSLCMSERFAALGLVVECEFEFNGRGMRSVRTDRVARGTRKSGDAPERTTVGLPWLYRGDGPEASA